MKRYIKSATSSYKVLDESDVKLLSNALSFGHNDNEWSYWVDAMEEVGRKYLSDPDEYNWFKQNCEENCYQVNQVDDLLADELKNHYVYDITTDDYDFDDEEYDSYYYHFYILMQGENSPQSSDGSIDYDSPNYLADFEDLDEAVEDAQDPDNNYAYPLTLWDIIEEDDTITCKLAETFNGE